LLRRHWKKTDYCKTETRRGVSSPPDKTVSKDKGEKRMRREDDFAERRKHIADLTDEELYNRFWELVDQVVDPLLELGRKNTTPSVERAVLLRMGVSSLDTQKVVEGCMDRGLMGHGAGHVVYKVMKAHDL
jgi:D-ornithine 4,5-aminomutase subunit alpha